MRALVINCTLKPSPQACATEALTDTVITALQGHGVDVGVVRAVDLSLEPGVGTDRGDGGDWPAVHAGLTAARILVIASPIWLGRPSSVARRVLERMDAMRGESDGEGRPVAFNRVAGVLVTGHESAAHHVVSEISGALGDIGYTIPGQAWAYGHLRPGHGRDRLDERGQGWSVSTGRAMASNLVHAARALAERPVPAPPS
ncbi:flavodoxin family protein [Streptomyces odontomachi]|uniref:flavodoxin family protein n=1 Tax=Streptomyces odontomachi TaxID=2944940 RepID=UPI00210E0686|nr:NAD(P)H-dependent oxidoreductase [Streptomyces sp. ODS25]